MKEKISGLSETENNNHLSVTESSPCFIIMISQFGFSVLGAGKTETSSLRSVIISNVIFH